jgi:pimeloyl-ACP methyl ester carboxylesterase
MAATMGLANRGFNLPAPEEKLLDYIHTTAANPPKTASEVEENLIQGWAITYGGKRAIPTEHIAETLRLSAQRSASPTSGYHHALAVSASPDRLESIKSIRVPTLIIHGRYDALLPLAHAEYLAQHIPASQLVILEMGHSFMWSWSNEVISEISKFIGNSNSS